MNNLLYIAWQPEEVFFHSRTNPCSLVRNVLADRSCTGLFHDAVAL